MDKFVRGLAGDWDDERIPKIFAEGLGENPRQIKRTVNMFLMIWKLAERRELQEKITSLRLAKVVAIQAMYPDLYNLVLKEEPRYLRELEKYYRAEAKPEMQKDPTEDAAEAVEKAARETPQVPKALENFISRAPLRSRDRRIMTQLLDDGEACFENLPNEELRIYFTLARSAEAPQTKESAVAERLLFEPQTVRIPAGKFLMGTSTEQAEKVLANVSDKDNWKKWLQWEQPQHEVELSEYAIGKYPVTNREYQAYLQESGAKLPRHWDGDQYPADKGDHPVVYVSWNDAKAYCEWLSEVTKKNYRLPTEAEWEKAARGPSTGSGTDGRVYPWGDEFDSTRCNSKESGIGETTPVDRYENGVSPYGIYDLSGNVWEWCEDWFDEKAYQRRAGQDVNDPAGPENGNSRVLRGGSFDFSKSIVRCAVRRNGFPVGSRGNSGFRVCVSLIS